MADPVKDLLEKAAKRAERVALMDTCPGKDDEEETRTFTPNCLLISFGFGRNDPVKYRCWKHSYIKKFWIL